jgi:hypothetical protein
MERRDEIARDIGAQADHVAHNDAPAGVTAFRPLAGSR